MKDPGNSVPEAAGFRWYWGDRLNDIQGHARRHYTRRLFLAETVDDTVLVGISLPEDVTEDPDDPVLQFHNITFYESPLFRGNGKVVIRLPPREALYQHYREARGRDDEHPALSVNDEVTYS